MQRALPSPLFTKHSPTSWTKVSNKSGVIFYPGAGSSWRACYSQYEEDSHSFARALCFGVVGEACLCHNADRLNRVLRRKQSDLEEISGATTASDKFVQTWLGLVRSNPVLFTETEKGDDARSHMVVEVRPYLRNAWLAMVTIMTVLNVWCERSCPSGTTTGITRWTVKGGLWTRMGACSRAGM